MNLIEKFSSLFSFISILEYLNFFLLQAVYKDSKNITRERELFV
jgi:hypothetical protein